MAAVTRAKMVTDGKLDHEDGWIMRMVKMCACLCVFFYETDPREDVPYELSKA